METIISKQNANSEKPYPVIESGLANVTVSSSWDPSHGPDRIRINFKESREGANSWCAASNNTEQYVILGSPILRQWHELFVQGRQDTDQHVTSFLLFYTQDGLNWLIYKGGKIFNGNSNNTEIVKIKFEEPLVAKAIKICPLSWANHISMRLEAYVTDDVFTIDNGLMTKIRVPAISSGLCTISSSSNWQPDHNISRIRLDFKDFRVGSGSWCAAANDTNQYIQISSILPKQWVSISTQGRHDYDQWVTSYYISYTLNGIDWMIADKGKKFNGNSNRSTIISHDFEEPFMAKTVRIHPISWKEHISMRAELYYEDDQIKIQYQIRFETG